MKRLLKGIRHHFPDVSIRVCLDGGFGNDTILSFLEEQQVDYVVGFTGNNVLQEIVAPTLNKVQRLSYHSGQSEQLFGECQYEAGSWNDERHIVYKCEVVRLGERDAKDNCRFLVTNLRHIPATVYEKIYCQRALVENRIKEMQHALAIDRTSCTRFFANQLRVIITAAAYALMQELRLQSKGTCCENAQVETLRLRLLKMGV